MATNVKDLVACETQVFRVASTPEACLGMKRQNHRFVGKCCAQSAGIFQGHCAKYACSSFAAYVGLPHAW